MSFLFNRSLGGPDEDYAGREVQVVSGTDGEVLGTALLVEQVSFAAAYSHVYKCQFSGGPLDGQVGAAKVLTTGCSHNAARAEPLLKRLYDRELTALTRVQHPHVIRLLGVGQVSVLPPTPRQSSPNQMAGHDSTTLGSQTASTDMATTTLGAERESSPRTSFYAHSQLAGTGPQASYQDRLSHQERPSNLSRASGQSCSFGGGQASNPHSRTEPFSMPRTHMTASAGGHAPPLLPSRFSAAVGELGPVAMDRSSGSQAFRVPPLGTSPSGPDLDSPLRRSFKQRASLAHSASQHQVMVGVPPSAFSNAAYVPNPDSPSQRSQHRGEGDEHGEDGAGPGLHSRASSNQIPYVPPHVLFAKQPSMLSGGSFLGGSRSVFGMPHRPIPSLTFMRRSASAAPDGGGMRRVLFLQWMEAGDARTLVDQAMQPMPEQAAASIILPVAQALEAAHKEGIVHRDVKAGNVLLAPGPGQVRLADWGISVHESESTNRISGSGGSSMACMPGTVGTQFWCAPELELGHAHGTQSDMFSLAITFLELITGKDPKYDNTGEPGYALLTDPEQGILPSHMSQEALPWVTACLSYDPHKRPSAAQLLQDPYFTATQQRMEEEVCRLAAAELESGEHGSGLLAVAHTQEGSSLYNPPSLLLDDPTVGSNILARFVSGGAMRHGSSNLSLGSKHDTGVGQLDTVSGAFATGRWSKGGAGTPLSPGSRLPVKVRTASGLSDHAGPGSRLSPASVASRHQSARAEPPRCRVQSSLAMLPPAIAHDAVAVNLDALGPAPYLADEPMTPGADEARRVPMCGCAIS